MLSGSELVVADNGSNKGGTDAEKRRAQRRRRKRDRARAAIRKARAATQVVRERRTRLERMGVRYFTRRTEAMPPVELADPVHILNDSERGKLRRLQRGAIIRAFVAGALAGGIVAAAMQLLLPIKGDGWDEQVGYWTLVGAIGVVSAIAEVAYMYWDSLRTVHNLAHAVGLDAFLTDDDRNTEAERAAVAAALARAALELPNPPDRVFGVDPRRELARWRLIIVTIFYKAKISLTNFIIKALVRRMLGRAGVRTWLHFVGVPVTALWNCTVSWTVMRQARIRVMGPSAAMEYVSVILDREPPLSRRGKIAALRAVGCTIVSIKDMHPNLRALLGHLHRRLGEPPQEGFDDRAKFLEQIGKLDRIGQNLVLRILAVAIIIDGRIGRSERHLMRDALAACGRHNTDVSVLDQLRKGFVRGEPAPFKLVRSIGQH